LNIRLHGIFKQKTVPGESEIYTDDDTIFCMPLKSYSPRPFPKEIICSNEVKYYRENAFEAASEMNKTKALLQKLAVNEHNRDLGKEIESDHIDNNIYEERVSGITIAQ